MKPTKASKTAEAAIAVRFSHMLHDEPKVFEDQLAAEFTNSAWRIICGNRLLYRVVVRGMLRPLRPVHGLILGRSRYAEDKLEAAIERGVSQYVILGAGFDTYAFRRATAFQKVAIFELDHPASQSLKRQRLTRTGVAWPDNLHLVPINFETHSPDEALARAGFNSTRTAFVAWLGTTFYLSHGAMEETLKAIGEIVAPGSELVFDYLVPDRLVPPSKRAALIATRRFASRRGEPVIATYSPDELSFLVASFGFIVKEDLSADDLEARYFSSRIDDLTPMPGSRLIHLAKA